MAGVGGRHRPERVVLAPRRLDALRQAGHTVDAVRAQLITPRAAVVRYLLAAASAGVAACLELASHSLGAPSGLMAVAAVALAGAVVALLAQSARLAEQYASGPLIGRAVALRRKSWSAAFQRQLNPDAPGHVRPRAPSAAPAAA